MTVLMQVENGSTVHVRLDSFTHHIVRGLFNFVCFVEAKTDKGHAVTVTSKSLPKHAESNHTKLDNWGLRTCRQLSTPT